MTSHALAPLWLRHFTATSCLGRGLEATLEALEAGRSGLKPCAFETVALDTHIGEVAGVDEVRLPARLRAYDCRNNRLAQLALDQDGFCAAVRASETRSGPERVGVLLGTSTSGILETEIAYRPAIRAAANCRRVLPTRSGRIPFRSAITCAARSNLQDLPSHCAPPAHRAPRPSPPRNA